MSWAFIAVTGYFLNALSTIVNKALLEQEIKSPAAMAFFIALLQLLAVVLIPFGVVIPGAGVLLVSILAGGFFTVAIFLMFLALQKGEASRVPAVIGAFQPIIVMILAAIFLTESLKEYQFKGFLFLALGGVILAITQSKKRMKVFGECMLASACFSLTFVMTKWVFEASDFVNGFFWTRIGAFLFALVFLTSSRYKKEITALFRRGKKQQKRRAVAGFFLAQGLGVVSFVFLNYAYSLGSVTLVNALQGVQYVVIFILAAVLARFFPKYIPENLAPYLLAQKVGAIMLIGVGLFLASQ